MTKNLIGLIAIIFGCLFLAAAGSVFSAFRSEVDRAAGVAKIEAMARVERDAAQHEEDLKRERAITEALTPILPAGFGILVVSLGIITILGSLVLMISYREERRAQGNLIHADPTGLFPVVAERTRSGTVFLNPNTLLTAMSVSGPTMIEAAITSVRGRALPPPTMNAPDPTATHLQALTGAQATQMVVALAQAGADTTPAKLRPARYVARDAIDKMLAEPATQDLLPPARVLYEVTEDGKTHIVSGDATNTELPTGFGKPVRVIE